MPAVDRDSFLFRQEQAPFWIFIAMAAVSTAAILIKLSESHPLTIAFWRLIIAEAILLPFAIPSIRKELPLLDRRTMFGLIFVGLALAMHFTLWIWSFQFTTVASSVLLVTTHPVFVAVISFIAFGERLNSRVLAGMALAFTGSVVVIGGDLSFSGEAVKGNLLALGGGIMAGLYILGGSRYRKKLTLSTYAFLVYGPASLFLLAASLSTGVDLTPIEPNEYLLFLLLAVGPMLAGHTIYNWALRYVSPTVISVTLLGEPVGSSILAYLILSENPGTGALLGGPVVLLGIFLVARYARSQ
jgi:drug/metabolite transporter (DMT)-like permease